MDLHAHCTTSNFQVIGPPVSFLQIIFHFFVRTDSLACLPRRKCTLGPGMLGFYFSLDMYCQCGVSAIWITFRKWRLLSVRNALASRPSFDRAYQRLGMWLTWLRAGLAHTKLWSPSWAHKPGTTRHDVSSSPSISDLKARGSGIGDHPQLHSNFQANMASTRPC